ncbi:heparinase II/III family protein [Paenibacillus sp. FSL H7-0331]|uniref:heparinase II/III domain-containing protein n=1 Tax=Paenibacillus sp. FSL H7-0331 TaxID=1920421 RepID=UPI00096CDC9B|nr:heparinase II/III family protein [Paenibacillus sp. FSL H7-0331]OMF13575.1 hypothetical protein BK127_20270 [Paenibacillus sp. FSL H7-0331]
MRFNGFKKKSIVWTFGLSFIVSAIALFIPFEDTTSSALQSTDPVKTRSTYYTPKKVQAARNNIAKYDWAKTIRNDAVAEADRYLRRGSSLLWESITPQTIPRSYTVNQYEGSPITGQELNQYGAYPYEFNVGKEPWKLTDPSSGYKFPTNDYGAYYKSGLNANGIFDSNLADRNLLVNQLYPDKGKTWGVDDGSGWIDASGNKFTFIAYYNHWAIWRDFVNKALLSLRDAYLYTGDPKYASAGIILLHRIADVYPSMDVSAYKWDDGFRNSHGLTGQGKILGSVWEAALLRDIISCYDAFFPAMQDNDSDWVRFLEERRKIYYPDEEPLNAGSIRKHIEDQILRQIYPAVKKAQIYGNVGFHQSTLAMAAVVLDDPSVTREWIDFIFRTGGLMEDSKGVRVTGGNINYVLMYDVDRDGLGNEASPEYNSYWLDNLRQVADILNGYDRYPEMDIYQNVKFHKMFSAFVPFVLSGKYSPSIGDSGSTGKPEIWLNKKALVKGFEVYGDPILAQAAVFANKNSITGLINDIFMLDPDTTIKNIQNVIKTQGTLQLNSVNLSGYGLAILRDGTTRTAEDMKKTDNQRDLWMYYGRNSTSHAHKDSLNLGMHAFGLDLMPDLGYVSYADNNWLSMYWERNTISHNTVTVDKSIQSESWTGNPLHFDNTGQVQLIDVEAPHVYSQTELYRRTTSLIRVDDNNSYAVDFFRVQGGSNHDFSFHTGDGVLTTQGLKLTNQPEGTYAGSKIPYANEAYTTKSSSGFNYLTNVKIANNPSLISSMDWKLTDTWKALPGPADIHLRLTMLGKLDHIALADGKPPQNKPGNPESLRYVIAHRSGTELSSTFTSVIEPYRKERYIESIEEASVFYQGNLVPNMEARAVKVTLKSGRTDYIISALDRNKSYIVDNRIQFQGSFGYYSEKALVPVYAYVQEGSFIGLPEAPAISGVAPSIEGKVTNWSGGLTDNNWLEVDLKKLGDMQFGSLTGRSIRINHAGLAVDSPNTVFEIKGSSNLPDGKVRIELGDTPIVHGWKDPRDYSKGYDYLVADGDTFTIPLSTERKY